MKKNRSQRGPGDVLASGGEPLGGWGSLKLKKQGSLNSTSTVLESLSCHFGIILVFFSKLFFNMVSGPSFHGFGIIFDFILVAF